MGNRYNRKHMASKTKVYRCWAHMKGRCDNHNHHAYKDYGGRGITYCTEWKEFEKFRNDMGEPPSTKHSLDRIDVNGNYCPKNCRWATPYEQLNNRRDNILLTFDGKTQTLTQWSSETGIKAATIASRKDRGLSDEECLTRTVVTDTYLEYNGVTRTLGEWSKITGLSVKLLSRRKIDGWSAEDILNKPIRGPAKIEYRGNMYNMYNISELSRMSGISNSTLNRKINNGKSFQEILDEYGITLNFDLDLSITKTAKEMDTDIK